jgi:hypothetical protein
MPKSWQGFADWHVHPSTWMEEAFRRGPDPKPACGVVVPEKKTQKVFGARQISEWCSRSVLTRDRLVVRNFLAFEISLPVPKIATSSTGHLSPEISNVQSQGSPRPLRPLRGAECHRTQPLAAHLSFRPGRWTGGEKKQYLRFKNRPATPSERRNFPSIFRFFTAQSSDSRREHSTQAHNGVDQEVCKCSTRAVECHHTPDAEPCRRVAP